MSAYRDHQGSVELVIPVHNEEQALESSVRRLVGYLAEAGLDATVTIADNASTDATWAIASRLERQVPGVRALHLDRKGRGLALREAWSRSRAEVLGYMDVDLSTDLRALPPLLAPLLSGHSDLAIGSRLARGSRVVRGPKRELISRGYNLLLRGVLSAGFSDAQCGFKAIRRDVAERLLPQVVDDSWFFDTELLVLAEQAGLRIHEVPVDWVDDPDSRVDLGTTIRDDLRGVARLARGRFARFAAVGVLSTAAYLLLYLAGRISVDAQVANLVALLVTAVGNTALNRRLTFGIRSRAGLVRHHVAGLAAFGVGLLLTSGALAVLHLGDPTPSRFAELVVLVAANALATMLRFLTLLRVMT
ncbi:MAG TPA: bifunctional glycosyltransferase family 2/GtrA family protein [Nocardioides sp.]|nr:bifunctional glycosyltransferase family 2/GtrA family protein [Nocardioides sp.]